MAGIMPGLWFPEDLRGIVGKTELRTPLGGDRRQALKLLPGAVAQLQHQIRLAEQKAYPDQPANTPARFRFKRRPDREQPLQSASGAG